MPLATHWHLSFKVQLHSPAQLHCDETPIDVLISRPCPASTACTGCHCTAGSLGCRPAVQSRVHPGGQRHCMGIRAAGTSCTCWSRAACCHPCCCHCAAAAGTFRAPTCMHQHQQQQQLQVLTLCQLVKGAILQFRWLNQSTVTCLQLQCTAIPLALPRPALPH